MPYCRKCGAYMDEGDRFCPQCGYDNQAQTLFPSDVSIDVGPRIAQEMPKIMEQQRKTFLYVAVLMILLFLVVVAISMFFMIRIMP